MTTDWEQLAFPRLCGLLASKPTRLSQAMHNAGFRSLKLDFIYAAFDSQDTQECLEAARLLGIRGLSLTIPHKERALKLVDVLSEDARVIGAVNTVINDGSSLRGVNTDWWGIIAALGEAGYQYQGGQALILGAGGAARAAVYALNKLGVKDIGVANRGQERARVLAREFGLRSVSFDELNKEKLSQCELLLNATSLGSKLSPISEDEYPIPLAAFHSGQTVFECVTCCTPLETRAREAGAQAIPGLRMLLHQALKQFELFTEAAAPKDEMERALYEEYARSET